VSDQSVSLEDLLERYVWNGPRSPQSPECFGLDPRTLVRFIDSPDQVDESDLKHLETCAYCLRSIFLFKRDREFIEAPLTAEEMGKSEGEV
jgi:hypothetical protein